MNINASDLKKGLKVIYEGDPYDIVDLHFVKPGKGQALYKLKLRNLLKGTNLTAADVRKSNGQYLYRDGEGFVFMEDETFEQYTISADKMGDSANFLLDGAKCELLFYNDQLIGVDPPSHVILEVTYTEPAARGNTTANVTKAATVETGAEVQVPAFIDQGEKIKVDARTGAYIERAK
jgi:elongation factor P